MKKENFNNIRAIFQEKTGVVLPAKRPAPPAVLTAGIVAAAAACVTVTAVVLNGASVKRKELSI